MRFGLIVVLLLQAILQSMHILVTYRLQRVSEFIIF